MKIVEGATKNLGAPSTCRIGLDLHTCSVARGRQSDFKRIYGMTVILAVVDSRIAQFHQQLRSHLVQFALSDQLAVVLPPVE